MKTTYFASTVAMLALALGACGNDSETTATSTTGTPSGSGGTGGSGTASGGSGGSGASTTTTGGSGGMVQNPPAKEDWTRDILSTDLQLDLKTLKGKARITIAPSDSMGASFEVGDLTISSVVAGPDAGDAPLDYKVVTPDPIGAGGAGAVHIDVGIPIVNGPFTVVVDYTFNAEPDTDFDGWMAGSGVSFLWPYFCGNLFPCKSDPSDGVKFTMNVTGVDAALSAVYPATIPGDAPSYMPAVAVGNFTKVELGTTSSGTKVNVWHLPGSEADVAQGTAHLMEVFDFYETTYGPYSFGTEVGTVEANWGPGDYGGMEHHPFWHVGTGSLYSEETNAHEAAHGWFGDGIRIQCWEDFVLSEGSATYLAARSLGTVGVDIWSAASAGQASYECWLKDVCTTNRNSIALPDTCNAIDILTDPLWSGVPYIKGAYFYQSVAKLIGADALDGALAEFYVANVGKAAKMQDLIDFIKTKVDAGNATAIDGLATDWLKTLDCPVDPATLCP